MVSVMESQIVLFNDILIIFGLSAVVLYICHRLKVPVIVGFLLTGLLSGPYGLGLVREIKAVQILAEVGIVSLLFTIGLEFSFRNLLQLRKSVIVGGSLQVFLTITAAYFISKYLGLTFEKALFIGFLISLSSTAIVMKVYQDRSEVETPHGNASLGILIFQDIIVVPMMLLTPVLAGINLQGEESLLTILVRDVLIVFIVIAAAAWLVPKILYLIAKTRSRELFLLSIIVMCLTIAWFTHSVGLSLALGAFLAGLIISESEYSHQALGNILPFRDVFTSFFFVSVGMLLDINFFLLHIEAIMSLTVIIIFLKAIITVAVSKIMGLSLRTAILVGFSLSQVGEFAFVLSEAGLRHGLLVGEIYQMFLAVSVLTMVATPFVILSAPYVADRVMSMPLPDLLKNATYITPVSERFAKKDHLIIIGYGINGRNLARAASISGIPYVIIEMNPEVVKEEAGKGVPIYYGDATQEAVLQHVNIKQARTVVVVINDAAATRRITELVRRLNPKVYLLVRTRFIREVTSLHDLGADEVIPEEFETSVEIFSRVLVKYLMPRQEIEKLISDVRSDSYEMFRSLSKEAMSCTNIELCLPDLEMTAFRVSDRAFIVGKSLSEIELRKKHGVTLLAIRRGSDIISHPDAGTIFEANDILFVVGESKKILEIEHLFGIVSDDIKQEKEKALRAV